MLQRFVLMPMEPPKIGVDRPPRLKAIQEYNCLIENLLGHNPTNPNPIVLSEGAHKYREQVDELVAAFETFPGPGPLRKEKNARPVSWTVFATRGRLSKNRCIRRR